MERNTRQRTAIRDAIAQAEGPLLPQERRDAAQQAVPRLGITTVYRNLKALVEEGELHAVNLPGENPRFELRTPQRQASRQRKTDPRPHGHSHRHGD